MAQPTPTRLSLRQTAAAAAVIIGLAVGAQWLFADTVTAWLERNDDVSPDAAVGLIALLAAVGAIGLGLMRPFFWALLALCLIPPTSAGTILFGIAGVAALEIFKIDANTGPGQGQGWTLWQATAAYLVAAAAALWIGPHDVAVWFATNLIDAARLVTALTGSPDPTLYAFRFWLTIESEAGTSGLSWGAVAVLVALGWAGSIGIIGWSYRLVTGREPFA